MKKKFVRGNRSTAFRLKLWYLLFVPFYSEISQLSTAFSIFEVLISYTTGEHYKEAFWKLEVREIESLVIHEKKNDYIRNYLEISIEFRNYKYCAMLPWKHGNDWKKIALMDLWGKVIEHVCLKMCYAMKMDCYTILVYELRYLKGERTVKNINLRD